MAYDDALPLPTGNPKLSEIGVDRPVDVISSAVNESSLKVVEQHLKISTDLANAESFVYQLE